MTNQTRHSESDQNSESDHTKKYTAFRSVRRLIALVGAHWRRGLGHLDKDWEQANQDVARFVKRLVEVAEIPNFWARPATSGGTETGATFSSDQI